ncbi:MAG: hypothetical protein ACOYN0_04880 [Phycisphaerales bacterium]
MKNFGMMGLAVAALVLVGCSSSNKSANMGAVNAEKKACCSEKGTCTEGAKKDGSMGAVGEKKAGCCSEGAKKDAAMGAVSEKKEGACSGKTGCDSAKSCPAQKSN